MSERCPRRPPRALAWLLACLACVQPLPPISHRASGLSLEPDPGSDAIGARIRLWQASERLEAADARLRALEGQPPDRAASAPLSVEQRQFREEMRERIARRTLAWVQRQSRRGYRPDPSGDRWPILADLLTSGQDDCDGWELLTFSTLRALGFGEGEIYRAVVQQRENAEQLHMVTLWLPRFFPGSSPDPWVLDPTAFVTREMIRLSKLSGWSVLRAFDESNQLRVRSVPEDRGPDSDEP